MNSGLLLLNKPSGITSNKALGVVKRLFGFRKNAGHTGTLDPLAHGLLPICLGEATKFSSYMLNANKEYIATITFGATTTTYDAEGEITSTSKHVNISNSDIVACLKHFMGEITQIPPIYSALKLQGVALYEYARRGEVIDIKPRVVNVSQANLISPLSDNHSCQVHFCVSKGTYIRSLAHDIGMHLGCGAYLQNLYRTKVGNMDVLNSYTLEDLKELYNSNQLHSVLLPIDATVTHLPIIHINDNDFINCVQHGHSFAYSYQTETLVRLYYKSQFIGIGLSVNGFIHPKRLINFSNNT